MKSRILLLTLAMLFCLTAQLYALTNMASGEGCGTNPLGDTSGDTDFYVSKNQNMPTSDMSSPALSSTGKAAVSLGSTAAAKATIQSLNPDKPSPQGPGASVVWKAEAANPNNEKMLYDYLLKGPATGDEFLDETGWTTDSSWTWNTTDADAGENQIEVRVMRAGASGFDASMTQDFIVSAATQDSGAAEVDTTPVVSAQDSSSVDDASNTVSDAASTEMNEHPVSKTATGKGKPRVAPDEKPRQLTTSKGGLTAGPNMSMPDPSPKSTGQTTGTTTDAGAETGSSTDESTIMAVEGKWTVKLVNAGSSVDLFLVQTGGSIVGYGNLNEQNTKIPLNIKGTVSADSMSLEAQTVVGEYVNKIDKSINLDLVKVDKAISGSYQLYSGKDLTGTGNATASRFSA